MPVEIKYIDDSYGIEMIGTGVVTGEEIYNAAKEFYSGDTPLKLKYQIANFANADDFDVSSEDIERISGQEIMASETNPNRIIAVVGKQDLIFGLSRMWEGHVFGFGFETMVFRDREEAIIWINEKISEQE